ncbi:hypothetical protein G6M89_21360 [Natronolimnobius sp. AArcel1]|uniref:DUF7344 domain-containing protein n=1 Tax=Natronolimnobius sp. AArcel1 TaxID=1679093 RepID=UPI0013EB01D5|nr:hypothetical protein [Natronolimnobius sp. AArcel1]NGM71499.1 hypothetical protein [Natronolimnobius sp. AArcel1]
MNNQYGSIEDLEQATLDESIDDVLRLLAQPYVRTTIRTLYSRPDTTVEQIAVVTAGSVAVTDDHITTKEEFDEIQLHLYHATLPRLERYGWIDFDYEADTVTETGIPDPIYAFLGVDMDE